MVKCSQCGATQFEQGFLSGFDAIKFHSVVDSENSTMPVAHKCLNCGHIELFAPLKDEAKGES
jgi:predicted nucleic-acid-binding Zn-ribbon protein